MAELSKSPPPPVEVETGIGTLALIPQRFEDIGAFSKLPPNASASSRLRLYLPFMAASAAAFSHDGRPPRIDDASIQGLSDEDLERVAAAYLSLPEVRQIADAASPSTSSIVRADGESAVEYLDRLLRTNHERQMENLQGTYEYLRQRSGPSLSSALDDVEVQAASLRDVATSFMDAQNLADGGRQSALGANALSSSLDGNHSWMSPEADVADRPNRARDEEITLMRGIGIVTTQSAILVASLSETATRFVRQFSETTQASDKAARTSLRRLLVIVLILGLFAVAAAATAIVSYLEERENRQTAKQWQESMLQSMKDTAAAQAAQIKSLSEQIGELNDRQKALPDALSAAAPPPPATAAIPQKSGSQAEAPVVQPTPKSGSLKRASKRKGGRAPGSV